MRFIALLFRSRTFDLLLYDRYCRAENISRVDPLNCRSLHFASVGMTKWRGALPFGFVEGECEQQVPPLRYAAVGMTIHFEYWEFGT
jgi:hypothetical protein